mmetsp:Transcript_3814/g.6405  ORF Transcript_3814/g.6405 Transcript_3814/m.6405 type:complete len:119 (+) Transcript_3814:258-614(+)
MSKASRIRSIGTFTSPTCLASLSSKQDTVQLALTIVTNDSVHLSLFEESRGIACCCLKGISKKSGLRFSKVALPSGSYLTFVVYDASEGSVIVGHLRPSCVLEKVSSQRCGSCSPNRT